MPLTVVQLLDSTQSLFCGPFALTMAKGGMKGMPQIGDVPFVAGCLNIATHLTFV